MNLLKDILGYAYRGSGKYIFIICVALSVITEVAGFAPLIGPIASFLLACYFCAIYFQMIQSSATGGREAPEFPDLTNIFEDLLWPMPQILVVGLASFGPFLAYRLWAGEAINPAIAYPLLAYGVIYFPMAMLAVVVLGYTGALSPHIVVPAIFRGGWLYWAGIALLILLYGTGAYIRGVLADIPILGTLVISIASTYLMMTHARILGTVYRERQDELGWL